MTNTAERTYRVSDGSKGQEVQVSETEMIRLISSEKAPQEWVQDMLRHGAVLFVEEEKLKTVMPVLRHEKPKFNIFGLFGR